MPDWRRWWNALRPGRLQREIERELRFHVAERIDELRESGMSVAEANRLAGQQFGNYTAQVERTRDMDISERLDALLRNGRTVYLHCTEGINRAPSVALAYLVRHEGLEVDEALAELRGCDPGARPYAALVDWLRHGAA